MYVLEGMLFPFEIFAENFDREDQIYQVISQIDCKPFDKYFRYLGCGRRGSDKKAMFRALVLKKLMGLPTTKSLITCLKYSPLLAYWCGFEVLKKIPSESTFSRFEAKLSNSQLQKSVGELCEKLAGEVLALTGSTGQVITDSTDIPAHERPFKENTDASFGHRTASTGESEMFYGYKLHLSVVNTGAGPVPIAARVAPANCSDVEVAPKLLKEAREFHRNALGCDPSYYILDAGYDAGYLYEQALGQGGQAIIKLNRRNQKNESKEFTNDGTPLCPAGYPMVYYGTEKKKLLNKFRCPRVCGQDVKCEKECGCESQYGYVRRISIKDNPRLFSSPHRSSRNWSELYSQRTAVERLFSILKGKLNLDRLTKRGLEKAFTDIMVCLITFLAGTVVQLQKQAKEKAA